jgi:hypothetical protein
MQRIDGIDEAKNYILFFEEPAARTCPICINREEVLQKLIRKKTQERGNKTTTTRKHKDLRTSEATIVERHLAHHK